MVNWDTIQDKGGGVPQGEHLVMIEEIQEEPWKGHEPDVQWTVWFEIISGPYMGRKIPDWLYWSDSALWKLKKLASRAGVELKGEVKLKPEMLIGKTLKIVVAPVMNKKTQEYRDRVTDYLETTGVAKKQKLTEDEIPF